MSGESLSLPVAGWPEADRNAWTAALSCPADPFANQLRLASLAPSTQANVTRSLARLMLWWRDTHDGPPASTITEEMTPEVFQAFLRHEKSRVRFRTLEATAYHLEVALEALAPDQDWGWVRAFCRRTSRRARHEPPRPRPLVHGGVIYDAGVGAMGEAMDPSGGPDLSLYRNALCVALLAAAPMRLQNLTALEIGVHLVRSDTGWRIELSAEETKTRRPDSWPLPPGLVPALDHYLDVIRPALMARRSPPPDTRRLWIGDSGGPVSDQMVRKWIERFSASRLGMRLNPHRFRHCAATTYTLERPDTTVRAASLLGHASPEVTERHYILQHHQQAQRTYLQTLEHRRRRSQEDASAVLDCT
jgi:integrase